MASTYHFDQSKFIPIVADFINSDCNYNEMSSAIKKSFRVYVYDNIPFVWLSDGYHFIEAHFTKEAINDFRKNHTTIKFSSLKDKMLLITKWKVIMKYEDSRKCYTSYQNISFQLVVEQFRPLQFEKPETSQVKATKCLYHANEIQSLIRYKRHDILQKTVVTRIGFNIPALPSGKDIFDSENVFQLVSLPPKFESDVLMLNDEEESEVQLEMAKREEERRLVHEQNQKILSQVSTQISQSEVLTYSHSAMSREEKEALQEDFDEIKEYCKSVNTPKVRVDNDGDIAMIDTSIYTETQQFYDVKRLFILERGEEDYEYIVERKLASLQAIIDDERTRVEFNLSLDFYQSKQQSRQDFIKQLQLIKQQQELQKKQKKKGKKVVRYRLGLTSSEIKEKMLRFLATFRPQSNQEETILEIREDQTEEPRMRAYSQENINHNDQSMMIETKTVASHYGGGYALSQYICPQSAFNDDDVTESEHEEEDYNQPKQKKHFLQVIKPNFTLFKKYHEWFQKNAVVTKERHIQILETLRLAREEQLRREEEERKEQLRLEQLERDREQKRIEAEQLRQQQQELERQRKLEQKQMKHKLQEEERIRKQQEIELERQRRQQELEELERERQRIIDRDREQREMAHRKWEEEEKARIEKEKAEQEAKRMQLALKQEEQRIEEENRLKKEEEDRIAKQKAFQLQKEKFKQQMLMDQRREEEKRARQEELRNAEEQRKQQEVLEAQKKAQAELQAKENERIRQEAIHNEKLRQEQLERKRLEELARFEEAQIDHRKQQIEAIELKRKQELEQERKLEEEKLEHERIKRAYELEMIAQEKKRKDDEIQALRLREQAEAKRMLAEQVAAERQRIQQAAQQKLLEEEESSSCSSSESELNESELESQVDAEEMTPAFQQAPSDMGEDEIELQDNEDAAQFQQMDMTQQSAQSVPSSSPSFAVQTPPQSTVDQSSMTLAHILSLQKKMQGQTSGFNEEPEQQMEIQPFLHQNGIHVNHHEEGNKILPKKRKRTESKESGSSLSSDTEKSGSESENEESKSQSSENSSRSSGSSKNSDSESDASDSDIDPKAILKLAKIFKKSSKKDKKKKKSKHSTVELLAQMLKAITSKSSKSQSKKSSSNSHKHSSRHHTSSDKKNMQASETHITSAFSTDSNGFVPQSHAMIDQHQSPPVKSMYMEDQYQSLRVPHHNGIHNGNGHTTHIHSQIPGQTFHQIQRPVAQHPLIVHPGNPHHQQNALPQMNITKLNHPLTSFEAWKLQDQMAKNAIGGNGFPPLNTENIPQNGQAGGLSLITSKVGEKSGATMNQLQYNGVPEQATSAKPNLHANYEKSKPHHDEDLERSLEQMQFYNKLNQPMKRPKQK